MSGGIIILQKTIFSSYLEQINRYPLLTAEQERVLASKIKKGDEAAKAKLVSSNLRLVVSIAKKYAINGMDVMDLIQEGNLGLITAAGKFCDSFNTKFSTYAHPWITQTILRYVQNKTSIISIPFRKEEFLRTIRKAEDILAQKLKRIPTVQEIATYLDIPEDKVCATKRLDYKCSSLNDEVYGQEGKTFADVVADDKISVEQKLIDEVEMNNVRLLLENLSWREKQVIRYRYNLCNNGAPKTLRQIGEILGVTSETVRQTELRAIHKLRKKVAGFPI